MCRSCAPARWSIRATSSSPDDDGVVVVPRERGAEVLAAANKRAVDEDAKRGKLAAGALSLDLYNMRDRLREKGLRYE
jgi:4-hydroxy-4-methyl-2-oxoglutarate aldolase